MFMFGLMSIVGFVDGYDFPSINTKRYLLALTTLECLQIMECLQTQGGVFRSVMINANSAVIIQWMEIDDRKTNRSIDKIRELM